MLGLHDETQGYSSTHPSLTFWIVTASYFYSVIVNVYIQFPKYVAVKAFFCESSVYLGETQSGEAHSRKLGM